MVIKIYFGNIINIMEACKVQYSFVKVASVSIETQVANVEANLEKIILKTREAAENGAKIIVFPELTLTGYSCQDLFYSSSLQEQVLKGLEKLLKATKMLDVLVFVGAPLAWKNELYNCAVIMLKGEILAVIPKMNIPEYGEFFEGRYFSSGANLIENKINLLGKEINCSSSIILQHKKYNNLRIGCELCEDLWSPLSPSTVHALQGANIVCNLSASNEYLGKSKQRAELLKAHTQKTKLAYIYTSAGRGESTMDVVYSDYKAIVELGEMLAEADYNQEIIYAQIDLEAVHNFRRTKTAFQNKLLKLPEYTLINFEMQIMDINEGVGRYSEPQPFLPKWLEKNIALQELFELQKISLKRRLRAVDTKCMIIGLSGGLDSTLTTLVAHSLVQEDPKLQLKLVTMPGFGTSSQTKSNAVRLAEGLGLQIQVIDIAKICEAQLQLLEHTEINDITYENVQARQRTQILLNLANKHQGILLGTADLSEIALGICCYGGDHLSMYNVNASIPKTLVRLLVSWYAEQKASILKQLLMEIVDTVISPELLKTEDTQVQATEEIVGNYEVIDYILHYHLQHNFSREKITHMTYLTFAELYSAKEIELALENYFKRFYRNQFKRSCMPDGAKLTCVSLSPRSSWRQISDL